MDNIAYLHLTSTYQHHESGELLSCDYLFNQAVTVDWQRLSSSAWSHLLPLALTLSVLGCVTSAWALERGDQGPSVKTLQQKLQQAGFYQASLTQVYDFNTEAAVRNFQAAVGLPVDGVANATTLDTLNKWRSSSVSTPVRQNNATTSQNRTTSTVVKTEARQNNPTAKKTATATTRATKRTDPNYLMKGDEGEEVRVLQQRLRVAGFYYGNPTGVFGPITEEAVKRFQTAYKLSVDGIVGPATQRKLPGIGVGGENPPKQTATKDKLTVGDRGEAVRILQEQLIKAGYLQGEPNGYFGPYTAEAVKRFQAENYLAVSGVAGPTTRAKLYRLVNSSASSDFSVLEIQRRLQERGFYKGQLNGVVTEDTKKAIRQAQDFYGISLNDVRSGSF